MKKFFAVVLGLALVLGLASVASAEFTASGKLVMTWVSDPDEVAGLSKIYSELHGDTNMTLKLSNTWDNASASLTYKFDSAGAGVVDGYEFAYAFSDQFTLKAANSFEVKTPIFDDSAIAASASGPVAIIGEFTLDSGWVKVGTNADLDDNMLELGLAAEFAFDPVTVGGILDYTDDGSDPLIGLYAKYALTDELTLIGDMFFLDPANVIAFKVDYAGDPFTAAAQIRYDIEGSELYYWKVEGSYAVTDATKLSVNYDENEAYEIKLAHTINEGPVLSFAYNQDAVMTAKIEAEF